MLFEFKNPFDQDTTVEAAFNQVQHYIQDIPRVFETNALTIISDGFTTLHGMFSSGLEWFAAWKSTDGREVVTDDFALETLIKGLLVPERLLAYIRYYIFHEMDKGQLIKKAPNTTSFSASSRPSPKPRNPFVSSAMAALALSGIPPVRAKALPWPYMPVFCANYPNSKTQPLWCR